MDRRRSIGLAVLALVLAKGVRTPSFLVRLAVVWPLRAVPPLAWVYCVYRGVALGRGITDHLSERSLKAYMQVAVRTLKMFMAAWAPLEAAHLLFYLHRKRELSQRSTYTPWTMGRKSEERWQALKRNLEALGDIHNGQKQRQMETQRETSVCDFMSMQVQTGPVNPPPGRLSRTFSDAGAGLSRTFSTSLFGGGHNRMRRDSSFTVEECVRQWEAADSPMGPKGIASVGSVVSLGPSASGASFTGIGGEDDLLALKRLEVSSWFVDKGAGGRWADAESVHQGDLEDYVSCFFFHGRTPDELGHEQKNLMRRMVDYIVQWAELPKPAPGRNAQLFCPRFLMEPLNSRARPLAFYVISATVAPLAEDLIIRAFGFRKFRIGTLDYWHRAAHGGAQEPGDVYEPRNLPLVMFHGLGMGLLMYLPVIVALEKCREEIFLVTMPHVSMRPIGRVPSQREFVAGVVDMLTVWGHRQAHFVGHSWGTAAAAWVLLYAKPQVAALSLLDPICFVVMKGITNVACDFWYGDPDKMDVLDTMIRYFAFEELHIAHTIARQTDPWCTCVWPEELRDIPCFICLEGRDSIVPAHSVRRLLNAESAKRGDQPNLAKLELMWFPDYPHGGFLLHPRLLRELTQGVRRFHMETKRDLKFQ